MGKHTFVPKEIYVYDIYMSKTIIITNILRRVTITRIEDEKPVPQHCLYKPNILCFYHSFGSFKDFLYSFKYTKSGYFLFTDS